MKIEIKCFSKLATGDKCDYRESTLYELAQGQTVEDLFQKVGINKDDVKLVFVNSKKVDFSAVLSEGDRVGLAPAIGGM